ncbi:MULTISPECIES: hypothetical protein [unclassified Rhizobium]|uniref:hypothetical protein n=1 Tax=unclassified Rhizobium TaxID=2613769 RepID=UPI000715A83B|nr:MULTISPECIES: hypothetical protein [unclassified Rhizobium]KQS96409.1 hypothetical protein ASG50_04935 [Rhizobium sp. Leaf386]KQT06248.1 hypothetical protein ASG42_01180 [Rhizobium sp. Leaf391]KQU09517.1 hypothetical protein ASG68_00440 [Rhizobium sp. Leaf453]
MPFSKRFAAIPLLVAGLLPVAALASSDDAWEAMRADVSAKCLEAAAGSIEAPQAVVDPFGSESFGLALVSGKPKGAEGKVSQICVYNKQTKAVELGGELTEDMLKGEAQ